MISEIKNNKISYFVSCIVWLIVVYPCLFTYDYFYLDTPSIEMTAKNVFNDFSWLYPHDGSGRYFPIYKLFNGLIYMFFGRNLFSLFLGETILFLLGSMLMVYIGHKLTKNKYVCIIIAVTFYINTPVAENAYTVGKPEALLLVIILLVFLQKLHVIEGQNNVRMHLIMSTIFVILAMWIKETAICIIVTGVIYLLIQIYNQFFLKDYNNRGIVRSLMYVFSISIGIVISKLPGLLITNPYGNNFYTEYHVTFGTIKNNLQFYLLQQPDIIILGVLNIALCAWVLVKSVKNKKRLDKYEEFLILTTAFSWAYICGMLLWRWPTGYYLLVPAVMFKFVLIVFTYNLYCKKGFNKIMVYSISVIFTILNIYGFCYTYYIATSQVEMAKLYTDAINHYINIANPQERLISEQWNFYVEPTYQTNHLITSIKGKNELKIVGIEDILNQTKASDEIIKLYRIQEFPNSQERMPKKGDFILVFTGRKPAHWVLRGVTPFFGYNSKIYESGYELELLSQKVFSRKSIFFDKTSKGVVFQNTSLGYKLFKVNSNNPHTIWEGKYSDNWVGREATLKIWPKAGEKNVTIGFTVPKENLPLTIDVTETDTKISSIIVEDTNDKEIILDTSLGKDMYEFKLLLSKTMVPKNLGINSDTRDLGILIKGK